MFFVTLHIMGNKKFITFIILLAAMLLSLAACVNKDEPDPGPGPEPAEPAGKTVLVYMVASNNLGSMAYDAQDLAEMEVAARMGALGDNGRLLVYHSPYRGDITLKEVTPQGIDTLKFYSKDTLSVAIDRMKAVFDDAKAFAPAKDYGLVMWSHATGWLQDGIAEPDYMTYSFGSDTSRHKMNITSLSQALSGQGFAFIYFDCCFMGSVETLYELRDAAPVVISSPTEDPVTGMPYQLTLKHLFAQTPDYEAAARTTFEYYNDTYNRLDCPVSMSVVRTEHLPELAEATAQIYAMARPDSLKGYRPQKLSLAPYYYFDLGQYVEALAQSALSEPTADQGKVADALDRWRQAMDKALTYKACTPWIWGEIEVKDFSGLSTYILNDEESALTKNYNQLQWYADVASRLPLP